MVVDTLAVDNLQKCIGQLMKSGLPAFWKSQFIPVDSLPYLGTGQLDLRRLKKITLGGAA